VESTPELSTERVVLSTDHGDLVLALYPRVAPSHSKQILQLVELGVYDTTHFYRIERGFVAQTSTAHDRLLPLNAEQASAIKKIPAEFSDLRHVPGIVSMARDDGDIDSAETSFSILVGTATQLTDPSNASPSTGHSWSIQRNRHSQIKPQLCQTQASLQPLLFASLSE
jgi:cyclophilin family peptidyl-prolyl cis-trans isomerase